jgi:hypothetical protein
MKINALVSKLKQNIFDPQKPVWIIISLFLISITLFLVRPEHTTTPKQKENTASLDTFVPSGYVLVTLQLINSDSIDSMIGEFAMVDLYSIRQSQENEQIKNPVPIATYLRLIRAPNNQSLFGVLVSEESRSVIHRLSEPVFAVIQGPNAKPKMSIQVLPRPKTRTIKYGDLL